jgi:hypothetical protein
MKTCSTCGKRKPLDAFYKQNRRRAGPAGSLQGVARAAERASWAKDPKVQAAGGRY